MSVEIIDEIKCLKKIITNIIHTIYYSLILYVTGFQKQTILFFLKQIL